MRIDDVVERFTRLSGLSAEEVSQMLGLITDCTEELTERIISDCDCEGNCRRITAAAAALANYRYRLLAASRGEDRNIKVGDVTIGEDSGSLECAKKIYLQCISNIADIIIDSDFYFEGI